MARRPTPDLVRPVLGAAPEPVATLERGRDRGDGEIPWRGTVEPCRPQWIRFGYARVLRARNRSPQERSPARRRSLWGLRLSERPGRPRRGAVGKIAAFLIRRAITPQGARAPLVASPKAATASSRIMIRFAQGLMASLSHRLRPLKGLRRLAYLFGSLAEIFKPGPGHNVGAAPGVQPTGAPYNFWRRRTAGVAERGP
jgi:hypothetical protein